MSTLHALLMVSCAPCMSPGWFRVLHACPLEIPCRAVASLMPEMTGHDSTTTGQDEEAGFHEGFRAMASLIPSGNADTKLRVEVWQVPGVAGQDYTGTWTGLRGRFLSRGRMPIQVPGVAGHDCTARHLDRMGGSLMVSVCLVSDTDIGEAAHSTLS